MLSHATYFVFIIIALRIQISPMLKATLDRLKGFTTEPRGKVFLKVRVLCRIGNAFLFSYKGRDENL